MGVILGLQYPLSTTYKAMWTLFQGGLQEDIHAAIDHNTYVKPVHVLRSIQLQFYNWFNHRRHWLTPPEPVFTGIINQIFMDPYRVPHLPPALYNLAHPPKPTPAPSDASVPSLISGGSASGSSSASVDASTISGITSPTTKPPPTLPMGRGAYMANLAPIAALTTMEKNQLQT